MLDIQLNPSFETFQNNPHAILVLVGGSVYDGKNIALQEHEVVQFVQVLKDIGAGHALDKEDAYVGDVDMLMNSIANGNGVFIITGALQHDTLGKVILDAVNDVVAQAGHLSDKRYGHLVSTVDIAPIGMVDGELAVGFYRRTKTPYRGYLALAGGYLHLENDVDTMGAASRIAREHGIPVDIIEQVETIASSGRDPRGKNGWAITILHYALTTPTQQREMEANGVVFLRPQDFDKIDDFAFDHETLAVNALNRVKAKARYSNIPVLMMDAPLRMSNILRMYANVTGATFNEASLRRKLEALQLFNVDEKLERAQGKPLLLSLTPTAKSLLTFSKDLVGGE